MDAGQQRRNGNSTIRKGGTPQPPLSLPYRVLARTCPGCGDLMTTPDHLLRRDAGPLPRCRPCRVKASWRVKQKRAARDEEYKRYLRAHSQEGLVKRQRTSAANARNTRKEWTGAEMELAGRYDLSASELAQLLGRTIYAVKHMRQKLRDDPATIKAAGLIQMKEAD